MNEGNIKLRPASLQT